MPINTTGLSNSYSTSPLGDKLRELKAGKENQPQPAADSGAFFSSENKLNAQPDSRLLRTLKPLLPQSTKSAETSPQSSPKAAPQAAPEVQSSLGHLRFLPAASKLKDRLKAFFSRSAKPSKSDWVTVNATPEESAAFRLRFEQQRNEVRAMRSDTNDRGNTSYGEQTKLDPVTGFPVSWRD